MGLTVRLEDEHGKLIAKVHDPHDFIWRNLPDYEDGSSGLLKYIDRYGDTVFNRPQMRDFIKEWRDTMIRNASDDDREVLEQVERMALQCESGPHLYLKFYGD